MNVRFIFSRGANNGFSSGSRKDFSRGAKVVTLDFAHLKLRKQSLFAKNLIGKCLNFKI